MCKCHVFKERLSTDIRNLLYPQFPTMRHESSSISHEQLKQMMKIYIRFIFCFLLYQGLFIIYNPKSKLPHTYPGSGKFAIIMLIYENCEIYDAMRKLRKKILCKSLNFCLRKLKFFAKNVIIAKITNTIWENYDFLRKNCYFHKLAQIW